MILLAVDTSGKDGSIALARVNDNASALDASSDIEILEIVSLEGGTFSAQLVPQIAALLKKNRLTKEHIDGFAVASGPGSFTGLRVGLAAIKAFAEILGKPIAAVSKLEAVARAGTNRGRVLAALDAGRNEVYAGEYDVTDSAELISERLVSREEFMNAVRESKVVTPERALVDAVRSAGLAAEEVDRPTSAAIARIGWEKIVSGATISPEDLEANYIRRSDAEIFAKST